MRTNIHRYIHGHTQTHTHTRNNLPDIINLHTLAWQHAHERRDRIRNVNEWMPVPKIEAIPRKKI